MLYNCFLSRVYHFTESFSTVRSRGYRGAGHNNTRKYRRIATAMIAIETRNVFVHCLASTALETASCIAAGFSSAIDYRGKISNIICYPISVLLAHTKFQSGAGVFGLEIAHSLVKGLQCLFSLGANSNGYFFLGVYR